MRNFLPVNRLPFVVGMVWPWGTPLAICKARVHCRAMPARR